MKKDWLNKNTNTIIVICTSLVLLLMTIGFANYSKILDFSGKITLQPDGFFQIKKMEYADSSNLDRENSAMPIIDGDQISFDLVYKKEEDSTDYYVEYTVEVENNTSYDYNFNAIDFTPYVNGSNGGTGVLELTLDGIESGDIIAAKSTIVFKIRLVLTVSDDTQSYDAGGTTELETEVKELGSLLSAVNTETVNLRGTNSLKAVNFEVINTYDETVTFTPAVNNSAFKLTNNSGGSVGTMSIAANETKTFTAYISKNGDPHFYSDNVTLKLSLKTDDKGNYLTNDFTALVDIYVEPDTEPPTISDFAITKSSTEGRIDVSFKGVDNSNGDITYTIQLFNAANNQQVGSTINYTSSSSNIITRNFTGINQGTNTVSYYAKISGKDSSNNISTTLTSPTISVRWKVNIDTSGLSNVSASPSSTTTTYGAKYEVTLSATGYRSFTNSSVNVTMGGVSLISSGNVQQNQKDNVSYDSSTHKITINNVTDDITISASSSSNCVTEDTLILLADGTSKKVKDVVAGDMLLVWNLDEGKYDAAPVVFNDTEERKVYQVINLYFSDETNVEIIDEHGFFDYNLAKYVYIDIDNYNNYIGHKFIKYKENGWTLVSLSKVTIEYKETAPYSPVTFSHLNYYTNEMLSMPGGISGLFNIFEVNPKTMKYDIIKKQQDIRNYGLISYEEYNNMFPEIMYQAFNGKYLNIAIKKGILTWENIEYMSNRYTKITIDSNK